MRLTMRERKAVTGGLVERYRKAGKKAKGRMLDELIELTGYSSAATIDRLLAPSANACGCAGARALNQARCSNNRSRSARSRNGTSKNPA